MSPLRAAALLSLALAAGTRAGDAPSMLDEAPSRYATLDGVRIHYKLLGRGKTALVFIDGFGGDMNLWSEQVTFFEKNARVAVIDLPKLEAAFTMKTMAKAVRAVLDDARIDRAVLIGQADGTEVIRQFDKTFPWRTRALVMLDPATWTDGRIVVPLLVLNSVAVKPEDVQAVKAMADDIDYQNVAAAERNTRIETWLTAKKLLR